MRTKQEQADGLLRLVEAAGKLHKVNLVIRSTPGGLMEAIGYKHAEDTSVVYVTGGYDLWTYDLTDQCSCREAWNHCQGHFIKENLSLEDAAETLADAYMEAKARFVITKTWGEKPLVAERVLSDPWDRKKFFARMDAGSDKAAQKIAKRHTN